MLRDIERWLAEARVTAAAIDTQPTSMNEYGGSDDGDDDPTEAWALDRLCEALLARGALVPLSHKLRVCVALSVGFALINRKNNNNKETYCGGLLSIV